MLCIEIAIDVHLGLFMEPFNYHGSRKTRVEAIAVLYEHLRGNQLAIAVHLASSGSGLGCNRFSIQG